MAVAPVGILGTTHSSLRNYKGTELLSLSSSVFFLFHVPLACALIRQFIVLTI